ncbi:MAG: flagellar filament capping protein FliD [Thermacetogeniaceae bacterium]|jgi:flagellar hook-associated protein 2
MSYSPMRIGGLVSGMDIDQIVSDLMKAERTRVDKLYQQKQIMEWQKADYRDINLKLRSLYNTSFDMKLSSSYLKYKAVGTMNDGADFSKYFSISPGASAVPGDYKVEVQQVASYARLESSKAVTKPLTGSELSGQIEITDGSKFSVTIDGVKKTVALDAGNYDTSNADDLEALAQDLEKAINTAFGWQGDGNGDTISGIKRVQVNIQNNKLTIQPAENYNKVPITLNAVEGYNILDMLGFEDGASYRPLNLHTSVKEQLAEDIGEGISFTINGHEFEFSSSASLQMIMDKINSTPEVGVTARYDALTDKLVFTSKETGLGAKIEITDESGIFNALGFEMTSASGQNARIVLNGTIVEKGTNDFTINGIRFNLNEAMEEGQEATFRLENDPDAAVESIKKYIELYNETIDLINKKISEERYRNYPPLTEEQKKAMSENDIKLWEERAKSGLLRSDPLLDRIVRDLRFAVSSAVAGQPEDMKSLSAIGITTLDWREKGKLYVNEDKLRDAISKDPEGVMRLFNATGENSSQNGVATRIYDILKGGIEDITEKAGGGEFQIYDDSILGKQIRDMEDRITSMEEMLLRTEERYWQKFTAMEQAIQYANQQSMWLASQMNMYTGGY